MTAQLRWTHTRPVRSTRMSISASERREEFLRFAIIRFSSRVKLLCRWSCLFLKKKLHCISLSCTTESDIGKATSDGDRIFFCMWSASASNMRETWVSSRLCEREKLCTVQLKFKFAQNLSSWRDDIQLAFACRLTDVACSSHLLSASSALSV